MGLILGISGMLGFVMGPGLGVPVFGMGLDQGVPGMLFFS